MPNLMVMNPFEILDGGAYPVQWAMRPWQNRMNLGLLHDPPGPPSLSLPPLPPAAAALMPAAVAS